MKEIFAAHLRRYPESTPQDFLKLAYQSEFGGGHLIENPDWSLEYIRREMAEMDPARTPGLEPIGGGLCRLHLQALDELKLRPETVNGLFLEVCRPRGTMEGLQRKLVGFKMIDRGIPRHEYKLTTPEGEEIGHVTSGTMSPCLKVGIGTGYVKPEFAKVGTTIAVEVRGRYLKAEVVKLPFV
jgi:hypothetical protein